MRHIPCEKCWLRYSSYCIGCRYEMHGIGMTMPEYIEAKEDKANGNADH